MPRRKKTPKPLDPLIEVHIKLILDLLEGSIETTNLGYGVERTGFDQHAAETLRECLEIFKAEIEADMVSEQERDGVGE